MATFDKLAAFTRQSRPFMRCLHLYYCREGAPDSVLPLEPPISEVAHRLALGVGGVALYSREHSNQIYFHPSSLESSPTQWVHLDLPRVERVESVSVGRTHLVALATDHSVHAAGGNMFGQCGYHGDRNETLSFSPIPSLPPVKQVVCGLDHTLLLTSVGRVFVCGWSADGQTGVGHYGDVCEPTPLDVENIVSIHACGDTSFAVDGDGCVYGWGNNEYGQLAVNTIEQQVCRPVQLDLSDLDSEVVSIATGGSFTGVLTSAGSVYVAGYPIEDPTLCVREGRTVIDPNHLCSFRRLITLSDITTLYAGLNYLVACVRSDSALSHDLLMWGQSPCESLNGPQKKVRVVGEVREMSFGATEMAALRETANHSSLFAVSDFSER